MYKQEDEEAEDRLFLHGFDRIEARSAAIATNTRRKKLLLLAAGALGVVLLTVAIIGAIVGAAKRSTAPWTCPPADGALYGLTFFVIGDWGRMGNGNQRRAAQMMADVATCMPPAFVISTGDNFYESGLKSANDIQFQESFVKVYHHQQLQVNWYSVLGNHDYGNGIDPMANGGCAATTLEQCPKDCCYSPVWQYTGTANDVRWHCRNGTYAVPTGSNGLMDIVMVDTNPFLTRYRKHAWYNNAAGLHIQNASQIKQQLQQQLAASQARWKLVVGHHPIASFGKHCDFHMEADCEEMAFLRTMLQAGKTDAYFCGHDHDLQYITELSDTSNRSSTPVRPVYVVSGAGSDVRHNEFADYKPVEEFVLDFMVNDQGFVAVRANNTHMVMQFYSGNHALPVYTQVLTVQQ